MQLGEDQLSARAKEHCPFWDCTQPCKFGGCFLMSTDVLLLFTIVRSCELTRLDMSGRLKSAFNTLARGHDFDTSSIKLPGQ
jgi:hypothetical protein